MFRKLTLTLVTLIILGAVFIALDNKPLGISSSVEPMIVLNGQKMQEKDETQGISLTTTIEAKEIMPVTSEKELPNKKKPIFDTTLYKSKNVKNESFFVPMIILYRQQLFPRSNEEIDVEHLKNIAQKLPHTEIPVILDIEHWNVYTMDDVEANQNIDKYILVIDTMKKARPDLKFGYYGVLPNRDYWAPVSNSPQKMAAWKAINQRLKRLAEHVDVVCPSLYMFYDDMNGWEKYAIENIKYAREYGKPVYPFIWPQYHESNKILGGQYLDKNIWLNQIQVISQKSDGIIIWGGYKQEWDENAPWWQVTKKFIQGE